MSIDVLEDIDFDVDVPIEGEFMKKKNEKLIKKKEKLIIQTSVEMLRFLETQNASYK
jgi:hypothetical protein